MSVRFADGDQEEIREILIDCVKKARGIEARDRRGKQFRGILPAKRIGGESLLVFRGNGIVSLWKVVTQGPYPNAWRVPQDSYERAGTPNNAAGFFLNNYFHQVPKQVDALIPLAVHTVLMAENDSVEGLQIGKFTQDIFGVLTNEELKPFVRQSKEIDSAILKHLQK